MEKMRGIFPVLFALVLARGIVLVPVHEARAEFPKPTDGICPCCGHVGLKTSELSSPYGFPMDKYVCPSCCYSSIWDGSSLFDETCCIISNEWSVDEQKGTHYHKCTTGYPCSRREDGSHLRAEVDAALMRKLQSRPFAIIVLADNGSR